MYLKKLYEILNNRKLQVQYKCYNANNFETNYNKTVKDLKYEYLNNKKFKLKYKYLMTIVLITWVYKIVSTPFSSVSIKILVK